MEKKKLENGFSIIICAYNAEGRLQATLYSLSRLRVPDGHGVEVILIDNSSTDNTQQVALSTWHELGKPFPLSTSIETRAGLSYARRRGVLRARYRYGIFCDDDNWLNSDYLIQAYKIFNENANVGIIGGCSTPATDAALPSWFYSKSNLFAVGTQAETSGDITWRKYVWGAGMCFRVHVLKSIYLHKLEPLTTDRKAEALSSGGDGEISAWFIFYGYSLQYAVSLQFQHFIPSSRLTDEYYQRFFAKRPTSLWDIYSSYLTVRYFLGMEIKNPADCVRFLASYVSSFARLIRNINETKKVMAIKKNIRILRQSCKWAAGYK